MKSLPGTIAAAGIAATLLLAGCKTTEANYREAYDKAVAGRDQGIAMDSTVYGKVRREMRSSYLVAGGDSVALRVAHVSPTPADDGTAWSIPAQYGVVAGQFKTLFNARSLCDRLKAAGYDGASVVNTSEPYYYVVAAWCADGAEAAATLRRLEREQPVAMREPLPFILKPAGR